MVKDELVDFFNEFSSFRKYFRDHFTIKSEEALVNLFIQYRKEVTKWKLVIDVRKKTLTH